MDRVLRHAVELGCDPLVALQMMTINTAQHFGVERDLGCLAPGRYADLVLADNLEEFAAGTVIANGEVAAEAGRLLLDLPAWTHEPRFRQSVHIARRLSAGDFVLPAGDTDGPVTANVIGVLENQAPTRHLTAELAVTGGAVQPDHANDVLALALVERHRGTGTVVNGFVHGFGFEGECAVASTVAHDSHHLLVVGTETEQMARAANTLADVGGGVVGGARRRGGRPGRAAGRRLDVGRARRAGGRQVGAGDAGDARLRLPAQQRLHAAQPARPGGHPGTPHFRPRPSRRVPLRPHTGRIRDRLGRERHMSGLPMD